MKKIDQRFAWPVAIGAFLMILGGFALATPWVTSISLAIFLGAIFLVSGVAQFMNAFRFIHSPGTVGRFLLASLAVVAGFLTLRNPVGGMMGITLALAFYLIMSAVGKWLMMAELRPLRVSGWFILSSVISLALGIYLVAAFPVDSLVVPGIFFGVDLIIFGASLVASAFAVRGVLAGVQEFPRRVA